MVPLFQVSPSVKILFEEGQGNTKCTPLSANGLLGDLKTLTFCSREGRITPTLWGIGFHATLMAHKTFKDVQKGLQQEFKGTWGQLTGHR